MKNKTNITNHANKSKRIPITKYTIKKIKQNFTMLQCHLADAFIQSDVQLAFIQHRQGSKQEITTRVSAMRLSLSPIEQWNQLGSA